MRITLHGRIPSKKNSVVMFVRSGRIFKMPSNQYRAWHKDASQQLMAMGNVWGKIPRETVNSIEFCVFAPDRRKADLTNKAESVMDLLVDNGILADDNWFVVPFVLLNFGGVDKADPRVEIIIQ